MVRRNSGMAVVLCAAALWGCKPEGPAGTGDGGSVDGAVKSLEGMVAEGVVQPVDYASISTLTGGTVKDVLVKEGDTVAKNQVLVRLDNRELLARMQNAKAEIARAEANLQQAKAGARQEELAVREASLTTAKVDEERSRIDLERTLALQQKGIIADSEVDRVKGTYERARAARQVSDADVALMRAGPRPESVAVVEAGVTAAKAALAQLDVALQNMELRAPMAGQVVYLEARPGEFLSPGMAVARVADTSHWVIKTEDLTELAVVHVEHGAAVKLTFDAVPGLTLEGRVTHVRGFGERKKGDMTYTVVVEPSSQDARLKWNMTASVQIAPPQLDGGAGVEVKTR